MQNLLKTMKCSVCFIVISLYLASTVSGFLSTPPVWLTSQYFRAGNENVINTLTGNASTPQYTFVYSSVLPGVPKLAYGIKNYMGNDYMGNQLFEIRRIELTASTFTVAVQIFGVTNIWRLNVPYIAIDPTFPHHLNSFDNVPVNYSAGQLTNITIKNKTTQLIYQNVINYTQQASGMTYTSFNQPLSNIKILIYTMAIYIYSTNQRNATYYPIDFHVYTQVLSSQTYSLKVTLKNNTQITLLHFSQIMFDVADVQSSNTYFIITQWIDFPNQGGFVQIPQEFVDNFIMGLTDWSTYRGKAVLHYNWEFKTVDGVFGVHVNQSIPLEWERLGPAALQRMGTMIFYMKTWQCPQGYNYFNLTTNMCQDMCGDYHYENSTLYECEYCNYSCLDCTSTEDCLACDGNLDNRILFGERACDCKTGYFEEVESTVCQSCATVLPNCVDCFYNNSYNSADARAGAFQFACFECDDTTFLQDNTCHEYVDCSDPTVLVNEELNVCQPCSNFLDSCIECTSKTVCTVCDENSQKFLNPVSHQCEECSVGYCASCSDFGVCETCLNSFTLKYNICYCPPGTYLDTDNSECVACSAYCKTCFGPSSYQCSSCNYDQHRVRIGTSCMCDSFNYQEPTLTPGLVDVNADLTCEKIDPNKCDRGYVYISATNLCIEICGDGVVGSLQCDDGNIVNGDGCSDQCLVQEHFSCSHNHGEVSVCRLQGHVNIEQIKVHKEPGRNALNFEVDISPNTDIYGSFDLTNILQFRGADIRIAQAYYDEATGKFIIETEYFEDLTDKNIELSIKSSAVFDPNSSDNELGEDMYSTSKATFTLGNSLTDSPYVIMTENNLDINAYSEQEYKEHDKAQAASIVIVALTSTVALFTLFLKNSLATIVIISSLQICFLGLSAVDGLHPITSALVDVKPIIGYNNPELFTKSQQEQQNQLNPKVQSLNFDSSYANNFNVMLFCQTALIALSGALYLASEKRYGIKTAYKIAQKQALLFILFNSSNSIFSLSIISSASVTSIVLAILAMGILAVQIIHFFVHAKTYYGLQNTFNFTESSNEFRVFLGCFILSRIANCILLSKIQLDATMAVIGAMAVQGIFVLFLSILRPFLHLFNNIFVIGGQTLTLGFFACIYANEGMGSDERVSAWGMVGICCGIAGLGVLNVVYSLYKDACSSKTGKASAKVYHESLGPKFK